MKLSNIGLALALTLLNIQESNCLSADRIPTFDECAVDADVVVQEIDGGFKITVKGEEQNVIFSELPIFEQVKIVEDKYNFQIEQIKEEISQLIAKNYENFEEQQNLENQKNALQKERDDDPQIKQIQDEIDQWEAARNENFEKQQNLWDQKDTLKKEMCDKYNPLINQIRYKIKQLIEENDKIFEKQQELKASLDALQKERDDDPQIKQIQDEIDQGDTPYWENSNKLKDLWNQEDALKKEMCDKYNPLINQIQYEIKQSIEENDKIFEKQQELKASLDLQKERDDYSQIKPIQDKIDHLNTVWNENFEEQQNLYKQIDELYSLRNEELESLYRKNSTAVYQYNNFVIKNLQLDFRKGIEKFDFSILNGSLNLRCYYHIYEMACLCSMTRLWTISVLDSKYNGKIAVDSGYKKLDIDGNVIIKDLVAHSSSGVLNLGRVYTENCRILSKRIMNYNKLKAIQNEDWKKQYEKKRVPTSDTTYEEIYNAHNDINFWNYEGFYNAPGAKVVVKNGSVNTKDLKEVELGGTTNINNLTSDGTVIIGYKPGTPEGKSYSCYINELIAEKVIIDATKYDKNGESLKGDNFDIKKINSNIPIILMSNAVVTGKSQITDIANKSGSDMSFCRLEGGTLFKNFVRLYIDFTSANAIQKDLQPEDEQSIDFRKIPLSYSGNELDEFNLSIKDNNSKTEIGTVRMVARFDPVWERYVLFFYDQNGRRYCNKEEVFLNAAFKNSIDNSSSGWSQEDILNMLMQTYIEATIGKLHENIADIQKEYHSEEFRKNWTLARLSEYNYPVEDLKDKPLEQIIKINVDNKQYRDILERDFLKNKDAIIKIIDGKKVSELLWQDQAVDNKGS